MTKTTKRKKIRKANSPTSVSDEISRLLLWLTQRWAALALGGFVLATILWMDFLREFGLPVSFISPGLLSALPVLGLAVGVPVLVATLLSVLMAVALWTPIHKDGPSLVAWASAQKAGGTDADGGQRGNRDVRPDLFNRWLALYFVHAGYWVCFVASAYWYFDRPSLSSWGLA